MNTILETFYALTANGVWEVSTKRHNLTVPTVRLVKPCGGAEMRLGTMLRGGNSVTVACRFIGLHFQDFSRRSATISFKLPEEMSDSDQGDRTPELVACFLHLERAIAADTLPNSVLARSAFEDETKEVLRRIGQNHPVFVVSRGGEYGFPAWYYAEIGIDRTSSPTVRRALVEIGAEEGGEAESVLPLKIREDEGRRPRAHVESKRRNPSRRALRPAASSFVPQPALEHAVNVLRPASALLARPELPPPKPAPTPVFCRPMERAGKNKNTFFQMLGNKTVRRVANGGVVYEVLPPGKYEVERIPPPLPSESEHWWVLKRELPEVVGNRESYWAYWFGVTDSLYAVKRFEE